MEANLCSQNQKIKHEKENMRYGYFIPCIFDCRKEKQDWEENSSDANVVTIFPPLYKLMNENKGVVCIKKRKKKKKIM